MRGTIGFERLNCSASSSAPGLYVRTILNDQVYPVVNCKSGPGKSCPLAQYAQIVQEKMRKLLPLLA